MKKKFFPISNSYKSGVTGVTGVTKVGTDASESAKLCGGEPAFASEAAFQSKCFQWHWNNYPEERGRLFHINQKAANRIEGNRMKAMGVVAGVSDMVYLKPVGVCVFIEMKTKDGAQSPDQKKFQALVEALGFKYRVVRTEDEFRQALGKG